VFECRTLYFQQDSAKQKTFLFFFPYMLFFLFTIAAFDIGKKHKQIPVFINVPDDF